MNEETKCCVNDRKIKEHSFSELFLHMFHNNIELELKDLPHLATEEENPWEVRFIFKNAHQELTKSGERVRGGAFKHLLTILGMEMRDAEFLIDVNGYLTMVANYE